MRMLLGIFMLFVASSLAAQTPLVATDITAADVQTFLKTSPRERNSDRPIRVVDAGGYRVGVFGVFRPQTAPATALIHETSVTEVYYMLEGAGALVTGGTLRKPVTPQASELGAWTDVRSAGIDGGVTRRVAKGDLVIIPGGVPHMWSSLEADVTYLIIRPDPDKKLSLK